MNDRSTDNRSPFNGYTVDRRILTSSFAGSVLVHVILVGMLFVSFDRPPRISAMPSAINVTMISAGDLPKPGPPPAPKKAAAETPAPAVTEEAEAPLVTAEDLAAMEPEEAPAPLPEPEMPEAPPEKAPEPETPPEKEPAFKKPATIKPAEPPKPAPPTAKEQVVIKDAPKVAEAPPVKEATDKKTKTPEEQPKPAPPEPKVIKATAESSKKTDAQKSVVTPSAARAESIKDAINKVKARAKRSAGSSTGGTTLAAGRTSAKESGDGQLGVSGGTGRAGGMTGAISDIYKAQISDQIERNWAFSANLAGGRKDLRTILVITIQPTGQIQNLWYEQRSGNNFLDQSAYNAVMKSNPLPPLPKGYPQYTIALVFTPSGLN